MKNNSCAQNPSESKCAQHLHKVTDIPPTKAQSHQCMICLNREGLIQLQYEQYLCQKHYEQYFDDQVIREKIIKSYKEKRLENIISLFFETPKVLENGIAFDKPYQVFLPQITLHFDIPIEKFEFMKLQSIIDKRGFIVNAKRGSTVVTIALASAFIFGEMLGRELLQQTARSIGERARPLIDDIVSYGASCLGNLINDPEPAVPDPDEINRFLNQPLLNASGLNIPNDVNDMNELRQRIEEIARRDQFILLPRIAIDLREQYQLAEASIIENIQSCEYELKIIQKIGIDNRRYLDRYSDLLRVFSQANREEVYLYHGCRLENNELIDPNRPELSFTNKHLINGFYMTDNIFYAAFNNGPLGINGSTWILYAKVCYNRDFLCRLLHNPRQSPLGILLNQGVIQLGIDSSQNFLPSQTDQPFAKEYIIDDPVQILPLFALRVMRSSYCIIWRSDALDTEENRNYLQQLSLLLQANIYPCRTDEEVRNITYQKRKNRIKFITNRASGLIEQVREIVGSNFLCLIYSDDVNERVQIEDRVNVLFTSSNEVFRDFVEMNMDEIHYRNFIERMQDENFVRYNINAEEVFRFPHFVDQIPYDPNRVFQV